MTEFGPVTALFVGLIVLLGAAVVFITPWIVIFAALRNDSVDPIAYGVCLAICLWEVCSIADWLIGIWR